MVVWYEFLFGTFNLQVIQTTFYLYAVFIDQIAVNIFSAVATETLKRSKHNLFTIFAFPLSMVFINL